MDRSVSVTTVQADPLTDRPTEFVERKGIGHPDTLCDGIAEAVSRALSRRYREVTGAIRHHNTDKVQLIAGRSTPEFGGGAIEQPIYVLVGGRATKTYDGIEIPAEQIARKAAREYVLETCRYLTVESIEIDVRLGEVSADLQAVFETDGVPRANDTSFGVGFAPLSALEQAVSVVEPAVRELEPVGEDVKVMGWRHHDRLELTIAAAMIDRHIPGIKAYQEAIAQVRETAIEAACDVTDRAVAVSVNTADDLDAEQCYLKVTGLSAEMGDDGGVGRGNRANGLITPHRPMSLEAVAGKNPVTHVGKLYNILATQLSRQLHEEDGADYAEVHLLSRIGNPITEPAAVGVVTTLSEQEAVTKRLEHGLESIEALTDQSVAGDLTLF